VDLLSGVTLHDVRILGGAGQLALFSGGGSTVERVASTTTGTSSCQFGGGTLRDSLCATTFGSGIIENLGSGTQTLSLTNVTSIGSDGINVTEGATGPRTLIGPNLIARGGSSFRGRSPGTRARTPT